MILPSSKFRYLYYNRSPLHRSPLPFESGNPAKFGTAFLWIRYNGKGFSLGQRKMEEGDGSFHCRRCSVPDSWMR